MKKLLIVMFLFMVSTAGAGELRSQFRLWKSSYLGTGEMTNSLISSSTIIFHMVWGSATVNQGGASYFALHSNSSQAVTAEMSTRCIVPLNTGVGASQSQIGIPFNTTSSSHTYYIKSGGADVGYLWDWYKHPPFRSPSDGD